jgi:YbgC/YbaW family acyl-CoA thioester hydrolase
MLTFRYEVGWSDIDFAGVVHYPRVFYWVDDLFHGYLRQRGIYWRQMHVDGYGFPFVHVSCRYMKPISLEDVLTIQMTITDLKPKGFALRFQMLKGTEPVIEGDLVRRCVLKSRPGTVEMPPEFFSVLQEIAAEGHPEETRTEEQA